MVLNWHNYRDPDGTPARMRDMIRQALYCARPLRGQRNVKKLGAQHSRDWHYEHAAARHPNQELMNIRLFGSTEAAVEYYSAQIKVCEEANCPCTNEK